MYSFHVTSNIIKWQGVNEYIMFCRLCPKVGVYAQEFRESKTWSDHAPLTQKLFKKIGDTTGLNISELWGLYIYIECGSECIKQGHNYCMYGWSFWGIELLQIMQSKMNFPNSKLDKPFLLFLFLVKLLVLLIVIQKNVIKLLQEYYSKW